VATETKDKVAMIIQDDCHITSELFTTVEIEKPAGIAIIRELGYRKVCSRWVLKILTIEHTLAQKNACAVFLQHRQKDNK
jgi:hypothetical protein